MASGSAFYHIVTKASQYIGRLGLMPLFSSTLSLRVALALTQAGALGLSLREVARAVGAAESSVQHALGTLVDEGAATALRRVRPRYVLGASEGARRLPRFALGYLPPEPALTALSRANRAVELAAYSAAGQILYLVLAEDADPADEVSLDRALAELPAVRVVAAGHDRFVEATLADPSLRERALRARILKGSAARSLPDRRRHGDFRRGRRLGRAHPSLPRISRRRLADLAARYGLRHIGLFGSAVRRDFRPDSDVDVLVRYAPHIRPKLDERVALEQELERLLEHDVDLIDAADLRDELRPAVEADEVALYGRA